jgi:hypothetical protein
MRTVLTAQVYTGNPMTFLDKLNQEFHYEYILQGHRLIHNNVILTLFQIFKVLYRPPERKVIDASLERCMKSKTE